MKSNIRFYAQATASLVIAVSLLLFSFGIAFKNSEANEYFTENQNLFQNVAETKTRTILAKPLELKIGEKFSPENLIKHLESIGYAKIATFDSKKSATYSIENSNIKISPRFPSAFQTLSVSFAKEKVLAIQNLETETSANTCQIEAETLGTFVVDNTNGDKVRASTEFISYEELKDSHLSRAIIASEDSAFFYHHGINYKGLGSAIYRHLIQFVKNGNETQPIGSGSSITQQLIKNILLSADKNLDRKSKELFLAAALERKFSKEQILELYLKSIYLGNINVGDYNRAIYGVAAGSQYYFGKDVKDLTIAESALIASLIDAPGKYGNDPNNPKLLERRERTLRLMQENFPDKYSDTTINQAKNEQVTYKFVIKNQNDIIAQPFVNYAMKQLKTESGVSDEENFKASYVIQTQIEGKLLKSTNQTLARHLREFGKLVTATTGKKDLAFIGSVVGLDRETGKIILMDGLRLEDGEISPDNAAFDSVGRDIASSIKPFILAYAMQKGVTLDDVINPNNCIAPDGWIPKDSSDSPDTIRDFFVRSKNKSMVCVLNETGYQGFLRFFGKIVQKDCDKGTNYRIANGINHTCSELSALQLASAFTIFPDGLLRRPTAFSRIFRNGEEIRINPTKPERIVNTNDLVELSKAMRAVVDEEVGKISGATAGDLRKNAGLPISFDLIGKSGSSEFDTLMTTISPKMVLSVRLSIVPKDNKELSTDGVTSSITTVPLVTELLRNIFQSESRYLLEGKFNQAGAVRNFV